MPWYTPNQGGISFAGAQAQASPLGPDTQRVIAAIIQSIVHQEALRQHEYDKLSQGVSQGVGSAVQGYIQGQQNQQNQDTASAAMYFQQNPQAYQDYLQTGQVPAGVTQGSRLNQQQLFSDMAKEQQLYNQNPDVRAQARAEWGGGNDRQQGVQERFQLRQDEKALNEAVQALNDTGNLTAKGGPRISRATITSPSDVHLGEGPQGEYIPEGYYGIGKSQLETVVPQKDFQSASDLYKKVQRERQGGSSSSDVYQQALDIKNNPEMTYDQKIKALQDLGFE